MECKTKKEIDLERQIGLAKDLLQFVHAARRKGFPVTIYLEVDGQIAQSTVTAKKGQPGDTLTEFLGNWIAGAGLTYRAELDALQASRKKSVGNPSRKGGRVG
jgi:hypothetical protein